MKIYLLTLLILICLLSCKRNGVEDCDFVNNPFEENTELYKVYKIGLLDIYLQNCLRYAKFPSSNPTDSFSFGELQLEMDSIVFSKDSTIVAIYFKNKAIGMEYTEAMKTAAYNYAIQQDFTYIYERGFDKEKNAKIDEERCIRKFNIGSYTSIHYNRYTLRMLYVGTYSTLGRYYEFGYGYTQFENPFQKDVLEYLKKNYADIHPAFKCLLEERFPNWRTFKDPVMPTKMEMR